MLNANDDTLKDRHGTEVERNIIQFVPFKSIKIKEDLSLVSGRRVHTNLRLKLFAHYRFKKYWLISFSHTWKTEQLSLVTQIPKEQWLTEPDTVPYQTPHQQQTPIFSSYQCTLASFNPSTLYPTQLVANPDNGILLINLLYSVCILWTSNNMYTDYRTYAHS